MSFSPRFTTTVTLVWGDGTAPNVTADDTDVTMPHVFSAAGVYNVTATADNQINALSTWKLIEVYDKISSEFIAFTGPCGSLCT